MTVKSSHGVIKNLDKVQFCKHELEYVRVFVTETGVKSYEDMLKSITNLPCHTNLSLILSWFGLVEQVAFAFSKADVMAPFWHLFSVKIEFV